MNTSSAGSYAFGEFEHNEAELARLKRQALAAVELERSLWAQAGLRPGMRVLDLACGPGLVSCEIAKVVAPGQVVGVDISDALVADAERYRQREGVTNVSFQTGNVYELDLPPASFDFVYARFLFQHLERPEHALVNIFGVLKPGGVFCGVDVDDAWLMLYPAQDAFRSFTQSAAEGQRSRGGDRHVGRKLGGYCHSAGFADVRTDVRVVTSHDLGMKTFLDITIGFKLEQLLPEHREQGQRERDEIYSVLDLPYAWGGVGVFVVTARRP